MYDRNMKMGLGEEVARSGLGSCQMVGGGLFESLGCATRQVVSKMDFRGMGCEDGRLVGLGQDLVKWWAVGCLNLWVVLADRWSVRWILGEWVVRTGGWWNWFRILSNGGL